MRSADCSRARLGEAKVQSFPLLDKVPNRARHVFDCHIRIDAVLIIEIDAVGFKPPQGLLDHPLDVRGAAIESNCAVNCETELAGDDDLSRNGASASPTSSS